MMTFKHLLQTREATPPATPQLHASSLLPTMAREPFPYEMLTVEKLDAILHHLNLQGRDRQIEKMEQRLDLVSAEMREIKALLGIIVARSHRPDEVLARNPNPV